MDRRVTNCAKNVAVPGGGYYAGDTAGLLEAVRKAFEYWNRGDVDAASMLWDDAVVIRPAEGCFERGFSERTRCAPLTAGCGNEGHDTVLEDLLDAEGSVVTRIRAHVSGHESEIEGDLRITQATTGRKGKAVLIEYFWDHREALEAAGLQEAMSQENVDVVRRIVDAYERRDFATMLASYDPEIEWHIDRLLGGQAESRIPGMLTRFR